MLRYLRRPTAGSAPCPLWRTRHDCASSMLWCSATPPRVSSGSQLGLGSNLLAHHSACLSAQGWWPGTAPRRTGDAATCGWSQAPSTGCCPTSYGQPRRGGRVSGHPGRVRVYGELRPFPTSGRPVVAAQLRARSPRRNPPRSRHRPGRGCGRERHQLTLIQTAPQPLPTLTDEDFVVTVCDNAHEDLAHKPARSRHPGTACTGRFPTRFLSATSTRSRTPTPTSKDGSSPWPAT